jgi:hypothetical protein
MIGPVQSFSNGSTTQSVEEIRNDLMVAAPQSDTELLNKAIGSTPHVLSIPTELPPYIHEMAFQIGQIQSEFKAFEEKAQKSKELEELRSRLLVGKKAATSGDFAGPVVAIALTASIKALDLEKLSGMKKQDNTSYGLDSIQSKKPELPIKDPTIAASDDQQNVILRIDTALNAINNIIDKISSDQLKTNNRILNLTSSISGLNAARSTVDKTQLSLNFASNAVDMIMTNIRTAVISHGKISNDIVLLVLS